MNFLEARSYSDLIESAQIIAEQSPAQYKGIVSAYYLSRFFLAKFESIAHSLPIQVMNEYRNSLDHVIRSFTANEDKEVMQLRKAEGHILRALGDSVKLTCHELGQQIERQLSLHSARSLSLIDNGQFLAEVRSKQHRAEKLFEQAKILDVTRGSVDELGISADPLRGYIDAAFAYEEALEQLNAASSILSQLSFSEEVRAKYKAKARLNAIVSSAGFSVGCGVLAGLFFKEPWVILAISALALGVTVSMLLKKEW